MTMGNAGWPSAFAAAIATLCGKTHSNSYFLLQASDEPPASEGPKPALPLDKNTAANLPQVSGEETPPSVPPLDNTIQHSSPNVVRKVLMEPAFPDHGGPAATQEPGALDEDDWAGGRSVPVPSLDITQP